MKLLLLEEKFIDKTEKGAIIKKDVQAIKQI